MKIRLGIIAIVLFGMNLVSCSKSDLTEENSLIELATEGDDGEVEGGRGGQ